MLIQNTPFFFADLIRILKAKTLQERAQTTELKEIIFDSRQIDLYSEYLKKAVFFAHKGKNHDSHQNVQEVYQKGIRHFILESPLFEHCREELKEASILQVPDSLEALQRIAQYHRKQYADLFIIGVTGSNGKTIVKEWLAQMLQTRYQIIKNPHSYNSQLGVPLSILQIQKHHEFGIFEAGISQKGEMEKLEEMITPEYGLFTNIGTAHESGFNTLEEKIMEKAKLFKKSRIILYCKDHQEIHQVLEKMYGESKTLVSWSVKEKADIKVEIHKKENQTHLYIYHTPEQNYLSFIIPFTREILLENLIHCIVVSLYLKCKPESIQESIRFLKSIPMRLSLKKGINKCQIIDDSYTNDLSALKAALGFMELHTKDIKKTLILSDIAHHKQDEELYQEVARLLARHNIQRLVAIGKNITRYLTCFDIPNQHSYKTSEEFLEDDLKESFEKELILVKGSRNFHLENIVVALQQKTHITVLETDLNKVAENLNYFRSHLKPETKIVAVVKAFAYGSSSFEIAKFLAYHRIDYLAVAYTDEAIHLRSKGIQVPIMVMCPTQENFNRYIPGEIEPVITNFFLLSNLCDYVQEMQRNITIHIKLDTGLHRLGFMEADLIALMNILKNNPYLHINSLMSHLASSDDPAEDQYTHLQAKKFEKMASFLEQATKRTYIKHLVNSVGIIRFPNYHYDMVRLGSGLHGVTSYQALQKQLQVATKLKTTILQIKSLLKGATIGYGRKGEAHQDMKIALISIGYADGLSRNLSNGIGKVFIQGKPASVVGNICMDVTMVDITHIDAKEGDEVIIFENEETIHALAKELKTIPNAILTGISQRVAREYIS